MSFGLPVGLQLANGGPGLAIAVPNGGDQRDGPFGSAHLTAAHRRTRAPAPKAASSPTTVVCGIGLRLPHSLCDLGCSDACATPLPPPSTHGRMQVRILAAGLLRLHTAMSVLGLRGHHVPTSAGTWESALLVSAVVTIDSKGFNARVLRGLRDRYAAEGLQRPPFIQYVAECGLTLATVVRYPPRWPSAVLPVAHPGHVCS